MVNSKRGEVLVSGDCFVDDRDRVLRFDWNALCEIEERFGGRSIDEIYFSGSVSRLAIREAITVGLKVKNRALTSAKVGRLINPAKMQDLLIAVFTGLAVANGQSPEQVDQLRAMLNDELDGAGGGEIEEGADDNAPLELAPTGTTGTA